MKIKKEHSLCSNNYMDKIREIQSGVGSDEPMNIKTKSNPKITANMLCRNGDMNQNIVHRRTVMHTLSSPISPYIIPVITFPQRCSGEDSRVLARSWVKENATAAM